MKKKAWLVSIFLIGLVIFFSIGKKEEIKKLENKENIELAIYVEEKQTNTIPTKNSGYYLDLEKSSCTNNASITWDSTTWSPVILHAKNYPVRCSLYFGSTYKESILNGADPVLKDELIAVTIDNEGVVRRASLTSKWYSYEEKQWANAVILKEESEIYTDNEIIPEENIESYFVWIPKYRYQLWDLGQYDSLTSIDTSKVHEIPIIFGDYNTSDANEGECTTPMESGDTGNCTVGDYMTHPAFLSIPSAGFWVGKFETGYNGATNTTEAEQNVNDSSKILIKPNTYSWRGIQVANAFYTSYNYQRNLDSHMMKNTEWGAVAYLQHSAYGSATSVRINNNSDYVTGYAANNEPTCGYTGTNEECNQNCSDGTCNTAYPNSVLASTTRNISGIFDMSGGAWEYVMGIMLDQNGNPMSGINSLYNSGFNGTFGCPTCENDTSGLTSLTTGYSWPEKKYYDIYENLNSNVAYDYQRRILGDGTGELGPFSEQTVLEESREINSWYKDQGVFVRLYQPFFWRSSGYLGGTNAGIFAFSTESGNPKILMSFRVVLTPTL